MHADLTKVRQALFNLLSNACKFTEHGTITLAVRARGGRRRATGSTFRVSDTGIGMTPEQLAQAVPGVHPGRRLDHAQVRRHRARAGDHAGSFCQMMGGDITVDERAGQGLDLHDPAAARSVAEQPRAERAGAAAPARAARPARAAPCW